MAAQRRLGLPVWLLVGSYSGSGTSFRAPSRTGGAAGPSPRRGREAGDDDRLAQRTDCAGQMDLGPEQASTIPVFFADKTRSTSVLRRSAGTRRSRWRWRSPSRSGLRILMFRTRTGTEMRATVDDRGLVGLTGADPVRANRVAWILGTELAAIGGILIASMVALDAMQLSLVIVSAYAAAIFGRLKSLPMTFVGAIVVGCWKATSPVTYRRAVPAGSADRCAGNPVLLALLLFPHGRLRGRDSRLRQRCRYRQSRGTHPSAASYHRVRTRSGHRTGGGRSDHLRADLPMSIIALSFVPFVGLRRSDLPCTAHDGRDRSDRCATSAESGNGGHYWR